MQLILKHFSSVVENYFGFGFFGKKSQMNQCWCGYLLSKLTKYFNRIHFHYQFNCVVSYCMMIEIECTKTKVWRFKEKLSSSLFLIILILNWKNWNGIKDQTDSYSHHKNFFNRSLYRDITYWFCSCHILYRKFAEKPVSKGILTILTNLVKLIKIQNYWIRFVSIRI